MPDPLDEDADIRGDLAALGPSGLTALRRMLEADPAYRTDLLRDLTRPSAADLADDEVIRLRLLRATGDLGV